jgi:site-specific DNA-methyltransferase (adenine-specific)
MNKVFEQNGIRFENRDCMEALKEFPDNYFSLLIADVPYGIGESGSKNHTRTKLAISKDYTPYYGNDLQPPPVKYFQEATRVSKNQIFFGANHFIERLPRQNSPCWLVWDKENGATDFADCELAWTSFKSAVRIFRFRWSGMLQGDMKHKQVRIHPNEKPIALYKWILDNYAQKGDKILDTHVGSASSLVACYERGFEAYGYELSETYYDLAVKRLQDVMAQMRMEL